MERRRLLLVVGAAVAALALTPGAAALGATATEPEPVPADELARFEKAMVVAGWSVMVERTAERVVAGRDTTYLIAVTNRGEEPDEIAIRAAVPPWMSAVQPLGDGEAGDGYVEWPVTVAPGEVTLLQLTGAYGESEGQTPARVAFTACAVDPSDAEPIVCGTDVAALESGGSGGRWWLVATGVAAAVAVAAVASVIVLRRRAARTTRPADEASAPA